MVSKNLLRLGTQKIPLQKTYEINAGQDTVDVEFLGANRQFSSGVSVVDFKQVNASWVMSRAGE